MPVIMQPERGTRSGFVAREAPADHNTDNKGAPITGIRGLATVPGGDDTKDSVGSSPVSVNGMEGLTTGGFRPTLNLDATLPGVPSDSPFDNPEDESPRAGY